MATILHSYGTGDSTYTCPQRREIDEKQLGPTVRRLSESSERRRSEQRRRSSVISEKTSVMGSLQSIRAGKLPTNEHLQSIINGLIESEVISSNKKSMSPDGQLLLNDFQGLLFSLQRALRTKNRDELFQSLIYHAHQSKVDIDTTTDPATANQANLEVKTGAKAILKISKLLLFNSKFRLLLNDLLAVARDALGGAMEEGGKVIQDNADQSNQIPLNETDRMIGDSGNANDGMMPRETQLKNMQQLRHDVFPTRSIMYTNIAMSLEPATPPMDRIGMKQSMDPMSRQTAGMNYNNSGTGMTKTSTMDQQMTDDLAAAEMGYSNTDSGMMHRSTVNQQTMQPSRGVDSSSLPMNQDLSHDMNNTGMMNIPMSETSRKPLSGPDMSYNDSSLRTVNKSKMPMNRDIKNGDLDPTADTSQPATIQITSTTDQLQNNMQQQQKQSDVSSTNEIVARMKEIFTAMQKHPDFQNAITTIFSLLNMWGHRLSGKSVSVSSHDENNFTNTAALEAKAIIDDWAQSKSLDPLIEQCNDLRCKVQDDSELSQLYDNIKDYVQRILREPGYLEDDQSTRDGTKLVDQVQKSGFGKYRPEIDELLNESSGIVTAIADDPSTKEISSKIKAIHKHLWYDSNGNAAFKPQLLNDIRITLIPAIIEQMKYIPLPQIIYSDKQYEIAIENMVLSGDTLMPDIFEVKVDDYLRFSPHRNLDYTNAQSMHITLSGIQTTMEDVVFYYRRKTGFPRISDAGVVNIHTGGEGVKINLKVVSNSIDQNHAFRIDQCHCYIDKLTINVNNSKHNTLYKVFNPVLTNIIKRQITKSVEKKLTQLFQMGDEKITKHLFQRRESLIEMQEQCGITPTAKDQRRPGLFSHVVNVLNEKVASI